MTPVHRDDHSELEKDLHVEATYRLTEALVEAEARMRRRVELLSEVVFEADAAGRLLFLNNAWTRVLGCDPHACLGRPLSGFVVDEDRPRLDRAMAGVPQDAAEAYPLVRMRRCDGTVAWMELAIAQIDGGGTVGALHDVTQRKAAEDDLAKLSVVASYTDNMVVITDREGRTEWVNDAFVKRTGFTLDDMAGRKPGDVLQGPDTDRAAVARLGAAVRDGVSSSGEILNYTKGGEAYWVQLQITPIRGRSGAVDRFVSIQTDATELHRTQQALEAARVRAEAANEAKTQFLATISHEMRTPLSAIIGSADLALDRDVDPAEMRTHLRRIGESAGILQRLISDVLDVAKIEAGQIDVERRPVQIRRCLQQAVAAIADRARAKGLEFRLMVDESLPAATLGDPDRIRQIVTNLAENAVKFTDAGFVRIEALRRSSLDGDQALEVRVADSGVGIAADVQTRIFDRFVQGDSSTTRRKGGAGLGLSIVKSLTAALGGSVTVRSVPGHGAEFRAVLPLVPVVPPASAAETAPVEPSAAPAVPAPARVRVLVAEDNDINFAVVRSCLVKAGYHVDRALTGDAAVMRAFRADLIVMDVEMPEKDGIAAIREIRALERDHGRRPVPILALTAHAMQEYRARCLAAGCTAYLSKPFRPKELLESVAATLEAGPGDGPARGFGVPTTA
jgi:PAS domain S-box-containing protein